MSAPKVTIELTQEQHDSLARRVAQGEHPSIEAAVAAAVDDSLADEAEALSALDDPAFVEEIRRRASDPPEMFEEFDPDAMMERIRARRADKKRTA